MRVERLGEKALLLRDLPCESYLAAKLIGQSFEALPGFQEATSSYETVGLYFDTFMPDVEAVADKVRVALRIEPKELVGGRRHTIPVCYELGPDLRSAADSLGVSIEGLIGQHTLEEYRCYAVGFSPGFAYLGYLPATISGLRRLTSPRARVEPGSVGITDRQTAVYPSATPGGWNLIGQCPLTLVDVEDDYFPMEAGDSVRFVRIDEAEFERVKGERL